MNTDRELMQQALEALEWVNTSVWLEDCYHAFDEEVAALRERLAQPEHEPVAWGVFDGPNLHDTFFTEEDAQYMVKLKGDGSVVKPLYTSPQPQMQPCAGRNCGSTNPNLHSAECFEDYEKATGMNQWHGLTDGEIDALAMDEDGLPNSHIELARAIEAKLREKNA